MITGIFFPDEGEIIFDGKKFDPVNDIIRIGYMPEERGLYKKMKIGEQALYLARLKGLNRADAMAKIKEWFVKLEMQSWWNKKVEDLSKGMSQKLQFVTTVLHEPKLIILDEPFSELDRYSEDCLIKYFSQLASHGKIIILITHNKESLLLCNKIISLDEKRSALIGDIDTWLS